MTSSPRTLGLIVTLLGFGALSLLAVWQLGVETKATPVPKVQFNSSAPAPARSNAERRNPESHDAQAENGAPTESERVAIDAAPQTTGLHGTVVDMDGRPVAEAHVSVLDANTTDENGLSLIGVNAQTSRDRIRFVASSTLTNEWGRFAFSPSLKTSGPSFLISVEKSGYLPTEPFEVKDPTQDVTLRIQRGASITLPVTAWPAIERDGNAAVRIAYETPRDQYSNRIIETFALDAFREQEEQTFIGLPADTYVVEVVVGPGRWMAFSQTVTVQAGEHRQLEPVEVGEGFFAFDLQVLDHYQRPVRNESMRIDYVSTGLTAFGIPATDAEGLTFFVVPNGLGALRMKSYNYGVANLTPSFGTRVSKDGDTKLLPFALSL